MVISRKAIKILEYIFSSNTFHYLFKMNFIKKIKSFRAFNYSKIPFYLFNIVLILFLFDVSSSKIISGEEIYANTDSNPILSINEKENEPKTLLINYVADNSVENLNNKDNVDDYCDVFSDTDFIKEFKSNVRPILDLYDELREILRFENIEFPKILVVGDQSAGKTSVLEAISKLNLPRGESTTTKCPTVIQLRNLLNEEPEYAIIRIEGENAESERKISLEEIDKNVRLLQEELLKDKRISISDAPIYLSVNKHDAPDLTLYDMPGLTYKNPEEAKLIREMYIKYLQGNNTIILLVISGTTDFTSSEAISIIKENCKDFLERTYLILTKADVSAQIDKRFQNKVLNNSLGLKFQPFIVRHRNQEELNRKMPFDEAIKKETSILSQQEFSLIPKENKGTLCLIKKLIKVQKEILINNKRILYRNLENELSNVKKKLLELPHSYASDEEKYKKMKNYFREISDRFTSLLNGNKNLLNSFDLNFFKELKVHFLDYKETFSTLIANFLTPEFYERIKNESDEISNLSLPNLFENINFHKYILEEIAKTEKSTFELVENIKSISYDILVKIIDGIFKKNFKLRDEIINMINKNIELKKEEVVFFINTLYLLEKDKPYTLDDLYMDTLFKTKKLIEKIKTKRNYCTEYINKQKNINSIPINCKILESSFFVKESEADLQKIYHNEILLSCFSYSNIIKKRFVDYVIRILMNKFVFFYKDNLLNILEENFSPLYKGNLELIDIDEQVEEERKLLNIRFNNIKNAIDKLNKIR